MIELREWARNYPILARPWLIVGKGPSFGSANSLDLTPYNVLSLNHVIREIKADVAHLADLDAIEDCSESLVANAQWVLMPFYPHISFKPSDRPLTELVAAIPVLKELDSLNRLVWYNLSTGTPNGDSPIIQTGAFGSEVVVNILALLGVKTIRTLGIDGGTNYSSAFFDLRKRTLLSNGAISYDLQFVSILKQVETHGIDFAPLTEPIRIFVGTDETQTVAARVLEYTIRQHASRPVEIVYLDSVKVPLPRDPKNRPRTGFSFKRFAIPSLCNYRGKAIYLDSDMIVFEDIAELWDTPMDTKSILCTWQDAPPEAWRDHESFQTGRQMSVMLMDCSRLHWDPVEIIRGLDEQHYTYSELMFDFCIVPSSEIAATLPAQWNSLENFERGITKLLHYTVVPTQPWISDNNPLENLWIAFFAEAVAAGAISSTELRHAIDKGFVKPALASCLEPVPPFMPSDNSYSQESSRSTALSDLRIRAAYGATLINQARIPGLEREIQSLKNRISSMQNSWTWRLGSMITHPVTSLKNLHRRFLH